MVKIRLRRVGAKKQPSYRVVVADSRSPRDGRFIETIGHYNPRTDPPTVVIHEDRALYWLSVGAQPSEAVARFFEQLGLPAKLKQVHSGAEIAAVAAPRAPGSRTTGAEKARQKARTAASAEAKAEARVEAALEAEAVAEAKVEVALEAEAVADATVDALLADGTAEPAVLEAALAEEAAAEAAVEEALAEEVEAEAAVEEALAEEVEAETALEAAGGDLVALGLSGRVAHALEAAGIHTVAALTARAAEGDEALSAIPGIGAKAVEEIREKLAAAEA